MSTPVDANTEKERKWTEEDYKERERLRAENIRLRRALIELEQEKATYAHSCQETSLAIRSLLSPPKKESS